jgi:hypothetical protein
MTKPQDGSPSNLLFLWVMFTGAVVIVLASTSRNRKQIRR